MVIDLSRRDLIKSAALISGVAALSRSGLVLAVPGSEQTSSSLPTNYYLVSSTNSKDGKSSLTIIDCNGNVKARQPINSRGHGGAVHPMGKELVLIGRRPADYAVFARLSDDDNFIFDEFSTEKNRHFYGHACYSADGKYLYTTENDYQNGRGIIGVRDSTQKYEKVAEWSSGGIGPHELTLTPNGKLLIVANGGILTHPSRPREKLNLDAMQSSLTYINVENGEILRHFTTSISHLSMRHIDLTNDGIVVIGCQHEGDPLIKVPLIATQQGNRTINFMTAEKAVWAQHNHYIGSVAVNSRLRLAAATSPRGNTLSIWNIDTGNYIDSLRQKDICGLATLADRNAFLATTGKGEVLELDALTLEITGQRRNTDIVWDNHLALLS